MVITEYSSGVPRGRAGGGVMASVRNRVKLWGGGGGPYPKLLAGFNKGRAHDLAS